MHSVQNRAHSLLPYQAYRTPLSYPSSATSSFSKEHPQQYRSYSAQNSLPSTLSDPTDAYMNPILPPPTQNYYQQSPRQGVKRSAPEQDDVLEQSNNISHQLKKLRLNNSGYNHNNQAPSQPNQHNPQHVHLQEDNVLPPPQEAHMFSDDDNRGSNSDLKVSNQFHNVIYNDAIAVPVPLPTLPSSDFMTVDDTPHKVYIADLDAEIAQIEAAEHQKHSQLFLPDFDKQIGAIPDHVLRGGGTTTSLASVSVAEGGRQPGPGPGPSEDHHHHHQQALILYQDPSSISVPEEEDAVRKAILDSRRAIRERMRKDQQRERETAHLNLGLGPGLGLGQGLGLRLSEAGLGLGRGPSSTLASGNLMGFARGSNHEAVVDNTDYDNDNDNYNDAIGDSNAMDIE